MAVLAISYTGQGFSPKGDKGRFVLPPQFRKAVKESGAGDKVLCIGKHDRWGCLTGFGLSRKNELEAQLDREEDRAIQAGRPFDRDLRAIQLNSFAEVPFDDSGRFLIPDYLMEIARIGDSLYFQGAGSFFTIWNPEELAKMGEGWEGPKAACVGLAAEAATKGRRS